MTVQTTPHRWPKRLRRSGSVLAIYWLGACAFQRNLIFPTSAANRSFAEGEAAPARLPNLDRRMLSTDVGTTEYWYRKAPGATATTPAGLVVFAHGNAELIYDQDSIFLGFEKLGYNVAMCEYRGYGLSDGSPSQASITSDTKAMLELLLEEPEVDPSRLIFAGRSIGTGIVCSLANESTPAAIILISPLESMARLAWNLYIPSLFVLDKLDNKSTLSSFQGPVLLMHGTRDQVIPFDHAVALQEVTPSSTLEPFDCGHNDFPTSSPRVWGLIDNLLSSLAPHESSWLR